MIRFADRHALRVALAALPDDAWGRPARWSAGPDGVAVAGDAAAVAALAPWGEPVDARAAVEASCWAEVFGLDPLPAADAPAEVLLQVPVARLIEIAGELLRLGASDLHWGATPTDGWIRARHPPRWTLERDDLVVYGRQGALWVQWGWRCPLADRVRTPADPLWLARPDGWRAVPAPTWVDVVATAEIALPPAEQAPAPPHPRLQVRVRWARAPHRTATLWQLDGPAALEALLTAALAPPRGSETLFHTDRPLGSFGAKIALAARLGLIDATVEQSLHIAQPAPRTQCL
jgi:hypothetical protein